MELSLNLGFPVFSSSDRDDVVRSSGVVGEAIGGGVEADSLGCGNYGYLRRLEDEMRKIEPFRRELPLCMILLESMIERFRMRTQHENEEEAMDIVTPSIEELFPLKRKSDDEESGKVSRTGKKWMSCDGDSGLFKSDLNRGKGCDKPARLDCSSNSVTENCGGFLQLQKKSGSSQKSSVKRDNGCSLSLMSHTSVLANPPAANAKGSGSSRLVFGSSFVADQMKLQKNAPQQQQQQQMMQHQRNGGLLKKQRRSWSPELHRRFLEALQKLGGAQAATPKQIRETMDVQGLTNDEVKSHLQKYRLNIQRLPSPADDRNSSQALSGKWNIREGEEEDEEENVENSDGHSWVTGLGQKQLVTS